MCEGEREESGRSRGGVGGRSGGRVRTRRSEEGIDIDKDLF